MLAASSMRLMVKTLSTQPISIRPLSMNLSSSTSTKTRTAASAKNEEQRCAEIARSSKNAEVDLRVEPPSPEETESDGIEPDGTRTSRGTGEEEERCTSFSAVEILRMEFETFL